MIKLISWFKRKPGTSHEEFVDHWRNVHGPLIARLESGSYVLRYEQHLAVQAPGWPEPEYDGCTIQWFESPEKFAESISVPDYAEMDADVQSFLDVASIKFILTEEPVVVFDRL
jgi:uncharacterized protein (TIGR02118 family)